MSSVSIANLSIFFTAYSQSDFFGKMIFLGLFACSLICWIVLIYKIWQTRKARQFAFAFQKEFEKQKDLLFDIDLNSMPHPTSKEIPHLFANIFSSLKHKTVEILDKNHYFLSQLSNGKETQGVYLSPTDLELIESHVLTTISYQTKGLEKNIFILSTIVTLAPFLGLLGTVWGILITFGELQGGVSTGSNSAILGGLSTALATTVLGLVIAIPALVAFNYLKNTTKTLSSDMEDFLYSLLSSVELQYRKIDFK
jgi:biopolymer transport protein TolQ